MTKPAPTSVSLNEEESEYLFRLKEQLQESQPHVRIGLTHTIRYLINFHKENQNENSPSR